MQEVIILQCDETDDPAAAEAIEHLGRLVRDGIVKPFWQVHAHGAAGRSAAAIDWATGEPADVDLLTALSGLRSIGRVRLVTIATDAASASSVESLVHRAEVLVDVLTGSQPAGVPFADIRVIAPIDLEKRTCLTDLFSAHATANLVLFPEDRMSDAGFALPMSAAEPTTFALHVAVETATQVGLWHDMDTAPVDDVAPGVMSGDIRVWLTRSYARIAVAPPLPVERAIAASEVLPVPPAIEPAPVPHQTAAHYAEQLFAKFDELHFHEPEPFPHRDRSSTRSTVGLMLREAKDYVRNLPYQFRHGAAADLSYAAGEALTATLGGSSAVEVVWEGKVADDDGTPPPPVDVDELRGRLLERLRRPEAPSFDQNIWSSLVDDIFAMVDGGATSEGTQPPSVGTQRVAVVDPRAVAPDPATGLDATVQAIDAESLGAAEPTAVGRLSARIRSQIVESDTAVDGLLATITRQLDQLRVRRHRMLAVLAWVAGMLVAALFGTIVVVSGIAEAIGVDTWSTDTRVRLLQIGSVALIAVLGVILGIGLRGRSVLRIAFGVCGGVFIVGGSIALAEWGSSQSLPDPVGTVRSGELILVVTIALLIVLVVAFCASQHTQRGRLAARLAGVVALIAATIVGVVAVVRPVGWYATAGPDEVRSTGTRWIVILSMVLVLVLVMTLVLRVRERLTVDRLGASLRWASRSAEEAVAERARLAQALRQWHGSALAVARTVWSPFGTVDDTRSTAVSEAEVDGEIRKLQLYLHEPEEQDLLGVMSRIRQEVADPGWLRRQYHVAVEAFQPRYAFQTGRALDSGTTRRPEADPAPEDPGLGSGSPGQGIRWMFADMLLSGSFDNDLRSVGSRVALGAVLESYFTPRGVGDGEEVNMAEFGGAIVAGEAPSLPVHLFTRTGLPVAGDSRAQFSTTVWWPDGITRPRTDRLIDLHETAVSTESSSGLVVSFVRSDWSVAMPLNQLPFAESADSLPPQSATAVERRADESSDVM